MEFKTLKSSVEEIRSLKEQRDALHKKLEEWKQQCGAAEEKAGRLDDDDAAKH